MKLAIKPGEKYNSNYKYIIINKKKKDCCLISSQKNDDPGKLSSILKKQLPDYSINYRKLTGLKEEIHFLWPQIVDEFKDKFPSARSWLPRARLHLENRQLTIELETEISFKSMNKENNISFIKKRLQYYLKEDLQIMISNGNFLEDIKEEIPDFTPKKQKQNPTDNNQNRTNNIIYGQEIKQEPSHSLKEIQSEKRRVIVQGEIFDIKKRKTRSGKTLITLFITDNEDSITAKLFLDRDSELKSELNTNTFVKIRGNVKFDTYSNELTLMINAINKIQQEIKTDNFKEKRIELHLHTQMSAMDSVVEMNKIIKKVADWGHSALAITDHGVVQAFPDAYQAGQKHGIKIIYGLEAYMVDDGEPIIINPPDHNLNENTFTVFDLETTGLNPQKAEIIEIGAVKIKNGNIIDEFSTLVKPQEIIPDKITNITNINNDMVINAPKLSEVLDEFIDFIKDSVLVAHNANFDYSFLHINMRRIKNKTEHYPLLDTLALSRAILPNLKNHKLNTVAEYMQVNLTDHHRALHDARATAEILIKFIRKISDRGINTLIEINKLTKDINWRDLPTYHTIILAKNQQGLKKLYKLVSSSHIDHFYRKPRVLKSELIQNRENLIIGSACEAGQLYRSIIRNKSEREIKDIARFYDYLEIQPLGNNEFLIPEQVESIEKLKEFNSKIYKLGKKLNKPVVATGDVHFIEQKDSIYRTILQTGQGFDNPDEQAPLYMRTTEEMLEEFTYLGKNPAREVVITNPAKISNMIDDEIKPIPDGLFTPKIEGADDQIRKMTYNKAHQMYGEKLPEIVRMRLEKELSSIIDNGYAIIYLISHKLVKKSLEDGYLVGSRGSVGSSLVATMCEITEVNPLPPHYRCPQCHQVHFLKEGKYGVGVDLPDKECPECNTRFIKDGYDIPFEVFLGFEGDKVPDIDLNFSGEYQGKIHQKTEELFGRDYVFRAGTISTIADRTAFGFVKGYLDDNHLNLRKAEINRLVKGCTGVRRTTGQHPGGLMVVPRHKDIYDFSPIQHPANDQDSDVRTTHFDYHSISGRILKLDLLGHDDPTSLRMLQDLTGIDPDSIPLDDPDTMSIFSDTSALNVDPEEIGTEIGTLGIPEFGTSFVRQMLVDTKPTTFAELIRISGLSHGTDVWLNNAQNLIKNGKAKLSEVISVRDDIMNYLIQRELEPSKAFWIMEHVRKGKGLTDEEETYMRNSGVPEWYIDSCKKIKYMFPKAHAAAYVMMAFRIAYFKVHKPEAFYTTYFSNKATDFDAHLINKGYNYIKQKKKELEKDSNNLTAKDKNTLTTLEIVIEAKARGIEFTRVNLYDSSPDTFIIGNHGLIPPLICLQGLGNSAAEQIAISREEGNFTSVEDLVNRTGISKTVIEILREHGALKNLPERNQLSLF